MSNLTTPNNIQIERIDTNTIRYYKIGNLIYPSITSVLAFRKRQKLKKWKETIGEEEATKISNQSVKKGNEVHELLYEYLMNNNKKIEVLYPRVFELLKPRLDVMKPLHMEISLWSDTLKIAGTADYIGYYNDVPYIIDFKTFKVDGGEYDLDVLHDYYLQVCAYSVMAYERLNMKIKNLKIMKISTWKYSEEVMEYDIVFSKQLLNNLIQRIQDFYKHNVVFPQK